MEGNLYKLLGSIITGEATMTIPTDLDANSTTLLHMQLGHMNEKGMLILHKLYFLK